MDLLATKLILELLDVNVLPQIRAISIHQSLASTNSYLLQQASEGAAGGTVCLAEHQTAGRGRNGQVWVSPPGGNLYLSILWHYLLPPRALGGLSLACGVAVIRVLLRLGISGLTLKWPNDVLWHGRKLAGLLLEVQGEAGGPSRVVVGLGLNVHLPPQMAVTITQPWAALDQLECVPGSRNHLVALILNELVITLNQFSSTGLETFLPTWSQYDELTGKRIQLLVGACLFEGDYAGVAVDGALRLQTDGKVIHYYGGEVKRCRTAL